jgi:hypothetical protein
MSRKIDDWSAENRNQVLQVKRELATKLRTEHGLTAEQAVEWLRDRGYPIDETVINAVFGNKET